MKRSSLGLLIVISVFASSCKMNSLTFSVLTPAQVTLSNEVKRVGIVNRSIPDDDKLNAVHKAFTLGSMDIIKEGGFESVRGLKDALVENRRFETVKSLDSVKLTTPGGGVYPSPLSWDMIENICQQNNVQVVFSLEVFDSQLKLIPGVIPTNITNPYQVMRAVQTATLMTIVNTGWRIYDPTIKQIIDEYSQSESLSFNVGANPTATIESIVGRKEFVKQTANKVGHIYAERILPHWYNVNRDYFVKGGNKDFKTAKRKAQSGNWDGAADIWRKLVSRSKRKTAGRASYNMAIINEMNGKLDDAIIWAQKSYEDYSVKKALRYLKILRNRKAQDDLLRVQVEK